ncbi:hypothetical protein WR25_05207 isoform B [Diploscapter pachys]|nr:hypothetical protein WR25_05207 isoform B [Diploscapter pachys]
MHKWTIGVVPQGGHTTGSKGSSESKEKSITFRPEKDYNTIDDQKDYEDPDYFYDVGTPSKTSNDRIISPPPVPTSSRPTHIAIHNTTKTATPRWRVILLGVGLFVACFLLVITLFAFFMLQSQGSYSPFDLKSNGDSSKHSQSGNRKSRDMEITPNHLLTLLITKRKVCLFEVTGGNESEGRDLFLRDHIETARLMFHSNLSHAGVPVHPLQFQRFARSQGVDDDCHVILYDRGQMIWSTYAMWIFRLFGHNRVSLLSGGYTGWKNQQERSTQYRTEQNEIARRRLGDFHSSWNDSLIITYDDVFENAEIDEYDIVDAQAKEEYLGLASGALFGHIKGARNIPVEVVYDWGTSQWRDQPQMQAAFSSSALSPKRSVIVYCSTSLRSSMVWWALTRSGYSAR